jgi:deazaflavin-dependent oxidoreductase (nitroreductase family)
MTAPPPRTRFLRPFATRVINPITRLFAGRMAGFAILTHVGRTSGKTYRTPINVFRRGDYYLFALTYGSDVHWVKNIIAADGCGMRIQGRDVRLVEPELIIDPDLREMPLPLRIVGKLNRVSEFLRMRPAAR